MITINLPQYYKRFTGVDKKKYAWCYLQKNHIELLPLPDQPDLETKNVLYCKVDPEYTYPSLNRKRKGKNK